MGDRTGIEWTGSTWTPIRARNRATGKLGWHCVHVSPGCKNCYAESWNKPRGTGLPFKPGHAADVEIILDERMLLEPLRWTKPRKIFVCSMTDLFADFVPTEMIDRVFAVMALAPQHTFQVLTKRAERMRAYVYGLPNRDDIVGRAAAHLWGGRNPDAVFHDVMRAVRLPLPNVWLGVSAEDQARADERVPELLATPAAVRFVSAEPLLGPIRFDELRPDGIKFTLNGLTGQGEHLLGFTGQTGKLDQIIVGGESGPGARPMHPDWARSIRDQCAAARTAFFFKQWGEFQHGSTLGKMPQVELCIFNDGRTIVPTPEACRAEDRERGWHGRAPEMMARVGKKAAGRELDGVEHSAMPKPPPIWAIAPSNRPVTGEIGPGDDFRTILSKNSGDTP